MNSTARSCNAAGAVLRQSNVIDIAEMKDVKTDGDKFFFPSIALGRVHVDSGSVKQCFHLCLEDDGAADQARPGGRAKSDTLD